MSNKNLRDHGLGMSGEPTGRPTWGKPKGKEIRCPHCGAELCAVAVPVSHPYLKGGKGISKYLGCPACPYASPAIISTTGATSDSKGDEDAP